MSLLNGSMGKESIFSAGGVDLLPESRRSPGGEHATHCNILAWRIPRTVESSGGLQFIGSQ